MEVMDYSEGDMDVRNPENNEVIEINDNEENENGTEIEVQMGNVACAEAVKITEETKEEVEDDIDIDSDQTCPICMDLWTSSGEHRLCCLRCGHLFGHSCILRWLQISCTSTNRRCPQCNRKAAVKDIRTLYAKKLTSADTSEIDKLKEELKIVTTEKDRVAMELSKYTLREKLYEQQLSSMQYKITQYESQQSHINVQTNHNISRHLNKKFHLERSLDICKEGGCRVLDYNPWYSILVVSEKSTSTPLFTGYGIRKVVCDKFEKKQFLHLHSQPIRDLKFHLTTQSLLLSVAFDKCVKLVDIQNNLTAHTFKTDFPLWSCCWSGDNPNILFVGAQNGSITQFDMRQTGSSVSVLDSPGDRSPVVSLATVPSNPGSGISRGGFIACHLNTCYAYERKQDKYTPKQIFLEGPFVSVCYDQKNNHALISSRPNPRQPHARHIVCTIEKGNDESTICNVVHTFHAGNSQQYLSRPCHINVENDTVVAAHQESTSSISLWSISTGRQLHSLPVSDPVFDMCAFEYNNNLFLTTLSAKKLRIYCHG